jgi:phosphoesterase RecJ-like protein
LTDEVKMLDRFAAFIEGHSRFLLTTHENPDGDGVGASVGLAHYLRFRGKEVRIVVAPHLLPNLRFLDPEGWIEAFDPAGAHADLASWPDAWLLVDASEPHRLGPMHPAFEATTAVKACLDHHLKEAPKGFDAEFTDPTATASGELVFDMATPRMGAPLPPAMATALYSALVADTGNFRFSNATPKAHRMAADLIAQGVDPARAYSNLYNVFTPAKLRLFGHALNGLELSGGDRLAILAVGREDLAACGATHDDLDELVQEPMKLAGIEVGALLYEAPDGRIKASLRSRERVDVNAVCRLFGGGGHRLASGCKFDGTLEAARASIQEAVLARIAVDIPPPAIE